LLVVEDEGKVVAGLRAPGKPLDIFYEISKSEKGFSWPIDLRFGDTTIEFTMEISLEDERLVGTWAYKDKIAFVLSGVKRPAGLCPGRHGFDNSERHESSLSPVQVM
jgi:hypothetical protein